MRSGWGGGGSKGAAEKQKYRHGWNPLMVGLTTACLVTDRPLRLSADTDVDVDMVVWAGKAERL